MECNKDKIIVDGHEYFRRQDGLYQTEDVYEVDPEDWQFSDEHTNMMAIGRDEDNLDNCFKPYIIANTLEARKILMKLRDEQMLLGSKGDVLLAITDDKTMGGLW